MKKEVHLKQQQQQQSKRLTRGERGYRARIGDEYIQLPKATKYAVDDAPHALNITHVRRERQYIRARNSRDDHVPRLVQRLAAACHDRDGSARARIAYGGFAPDAARSARDENDFPVVGLRGVKWLGVDGGVDADAGGINLSLKGGKKGER